MDETQIEDLLQRLSDRLQERGVVAEVVIYGGAAMVLAHRARIATKDVDAVFVPKQEVYEAAAQVAADAGVEPDWLNDAVKGFLSDRGEALPLREWPGLKVFVAAPEYLLAMKCMSMRLGQGTSDLDDIKFLMDRLGLREAEEVLALVAGYYPEERIPPKTRFAIEEICQRIKPS